MGVDYKAILFYGFELPEDFEDQLEKFDYDWEPWLAKKLGVVFPSPEYKKAVEDLGVTIVTAYMFDESIYALAFADSYHSAYFEIVQFDMPDFKDKHEVLKSACLKLGIEYKEPKWSLVVEAF